MDLHDEKIFKDGADYWQIADNIRGIYMSEGSLLTLLDFERVLDELDLYAFQNWEIGELVSGPDIGKYMVTCVFMWPEKRMPDPRGARRLLPFDCTVMLAHQLAGGDIKKIPPFRYVDHLDAQGSKAFAENLHACVCINTKDEAVHVSTIHWSKIRAHLPLTKYGLIKLDPNVVDVHLVNNEYEACETARRIIKKGEAGFVTPDSVELKKDKPTKMRLDNYASDLLGD
jgi:hypothetical protein